ncbi:DNA/RNA helicase domain-containing protein [Streptomyces sp. NPDC058398]|uniref:DNA/RNA helicase domain-containing protein n=1 Tax=Streptomyces sp. NPDC058398 TaxID=3346479 RepID=UPI00365D526A
MHVFEGTVHEAAARLAEPGFVARCAARYTAGHGRPPGEEELASWENSWPALVEALGAAGLGELQLLLEYELPGSSQRIDALILGARAGRLTAVVVELKQWTTAAPHPAGAGMLRVGRREVLHPARQVGGYVTYLTHWVPAELGLDVHGLVYLHNASAELVGHLREQTADGPSACYPLLGAADLPRDAGAAQLTERLLCTGLEPADRSSIDGFVQAHHRPSPQLLSRVATTIGGHDGFRLIGDQDKARQVIHQAIRAVDRKSPGHVVVVTGGPGTGKTAIAARVLGDLCLTKGANPRLLSPSGTLTQQLTRAVGESAKGLIQTLTTTLPAGLDKHSSVVLLDEAHRARTDPLRRHTQFPNLFTRLIQGCAALVLFLDERQIVRPNEGTTRDELQQLAGAYGYTFAHIDLATQFRCGGSRTYLDWIDAVLSPGATAPTWRGSDYDLAVADTPAALEDWVGAHVHEGHSARITAGYCWPWKSSLTPPLLPEVSHSWHDDAGEHHWERPWNAGADGILAGTDTPGRAFWATDAGGHQQIGCVYTAQGMEYDYSAVILGNDLTWTANGWQAHPEESHDPALVGLTPHQYLRYALNTYRVLATRGTRGTRLYSTDPDTQAYLHQLIHPDDHGPDTAAQDRQ